MPGDEKGFDNPFAAFGNINFDIDGTGDEDAPIELLTMDENMVDEPLELANLEAPSILATRPAEREQTSLMSPEQIKAELAAYDMPETSLSILSEDSQTRLLEALRKKQDVAEFQTIGAMQVQGQTLMPSVIKTSKELAERGINADLLTPKEAQNLSEFAHFRPENTDTQLEMIRDILTQSKNGVNARRDYANIDNPHYNREKKENLERIIDQINDYLDEGGYENIHRDPDVVTEEEREALIEEYGNDPVFRHANREELIELGYLEEREEGILGPLTESDLSIAESLVRPTYADMLSSRSKDVVGEIRSVARFAPATSNSNLFDAMLNRYIETEITAERTIEGKTLIEGFMALEKSFMESDFTKRMHEYLAQNPNKNLDKTLIKLRRILLQGGRICSILCGGSDKEAREKYGTMLPQKSEFFDEVLEKASRWTERDNARAKKSQYEFLIKLDNTFQEARIAYSGLNSILEAQGGNATPESNELPEGASISQQGVKKMLELSGALHSAELTSDGDVEMPEDYGA
jgi:hypothetical protein